MHKQLEKMVLRYQELEQLLGTPQVASNRDTYNKYAKELSGLAEACGLSREYEKIAKELDEMAHFLKEKHDAELLALAQKETVELSRRKAGVEEKISKLFKSEDKDAGKNVIVEIRAGTGGSEAGLFVADLYRMYTKYAANKKWKIDQMSGSTTEVGGMKEIVFAVLGKDAYKRLKFESGVHRVQRVPQTEAQGRIHTSTVTVAILVEPQDVELVVEPKDLRIDTYRSSGPGGQHMQKTDSAVRITHIPTGVVVACQDERSQLKNKTKALRILSARILDKKKIEDSKKLSQERRSQIGSGDRSEKIRTYNYPDRRVTDHRINFTSHQLEAILEGELDELSDALIKAEEEKARQAAND